MGVCELNSSYNEGFNWRSNSEFYIVPKKYRAGPKPIQTPIPLRPSAGRNPDWSIKATYETFRILIRIGYLKLRFICLELNSL